MEHLPIPPLPIPRRRCIIGEEQNRRPSLDSAYRAAEKPCLKRTRSSRFSQRVASTRTRHGILRRHDRFLARSICYPSDVPATPSCLPGLASLTEADGDCSVIAQIKRSTKTGPLTCWNTRRGCRIVRSTRTQSPCPKCCTAVSTT